jgi:hypothetical protein
VRELLGEPGHGRVLVVDAGDRCAVPCWGTCWPRKGWITVGPGW